MSNEMKDWLRDQQCEKIQTLIRDLNNWTKEYDKGTPIVTDEEWDRAYFELKNLEQESGITMEDSPTQKITYEVVTKLEKVKHNHDMLSLDKTKDWNEFVRYFGNKAVDLMLKMDGLTCCLTYENGVLVSAETRGNGEIGEAILHNARIIKSIPKKISYQERLVIDGEVICRYQDFEPFSIEYKNPRNFASGSIRLLESEECAKRNLTFVAWNVVEGLEGNSFIDKLQDLLKLGFTIVPWASSLCDDAKEFLQNEAKKLGYPIDGLVGRFDDIDYGTSLGSTAHHANAAYAFKFYDETYETELQDIEWSMGRTGQLTPVAIFKEIEMDGSMVNRANMFNINTMIDLLGEHPYVGEKLQVYKANAIIPQISSADKQESAELQLSIPSVCPICGEATEIEIFDSGTANLVCSNPTCDGKLINILDHFAGIKGLKIKGLSKATLEKLISWDWIENISDIFTLVNHKDEWILKPGFGVKSVTNILNSIEAAKNTTLESFISSLGIPLIGRTVAKELCKHINSYEDFREKVDNKFNFSEYDGFAGAKTDAIWNYDYTEADKIYPLLNIAEVTLNSVQHSCDGLTICITGKLQQFKKRDDFKAWIEERGGKVTNSVTSKTNYLINNDINSTTSKNATAKKLNVPIITEEGFIKEFG
jgi:DNA ligase (NAD+)